MDADWYVSLSVAYSNVQSKSFMCVCVCGFVARVSGGLNACGSHEDKWDANLSESTNCL